MPIADASAGRQVRPWGPTAPAQRWDAVVIGAGMGGMVAAGLLSRVGRRVLVLEQHRVPGGLTQSFRRGPWAWDVGLHVVGEMGPGGLGGRLLSRLAGRALGWTRIDGPYDVVVLPDGDRVGLPGGMAALRASLERSFPAEREGIRRYFSLTRTAAAAMRDLFLARPLSGARAAKANGDAARLALSTTGEVLASVTADPKLRVVLGIQWGFYGSPPDESAFGVHALLQRHYRGGAFYPEGGAMSLPRALAAGLAQAGGWTRTGADVEAILVDRAAVRGVRLTSGEEIRAGLVISAAGALGTVRLLPEEERRREWALSIGALPPSLTHLSLNVGFRGDIAAAGASRSNLWLVTGEGGEGPWTLEGSPGACYASFPSLKDGAAREPSGAHTAELVTLVRWDDFRRWAGTRWRRRGPDYDALKLELSTRMLELLFRRLPGLRPLVAHVELSTPLSMAHFVRAANGASYGLASTPERYRNPWLRPRTPVRGLYLAGCDVASVGIMGALAGGVAAALSVDPARVMPWLRAAVRSRAVRLDP
ncbi:MAG TPA: NAD(P)/FAD-dependent oxidoreductase [Myxococcales bacterium]|nr:NAD(P)/FAD-dependent oxidoreductase [Myxococcales bacterium]